MPHAAGYEAMPPMSTRGIKAVGGYQRCLTETLVRWMKVDNRLVGRYKLTAEKPVLRGLFPRTEHILCKRLADARSSHGMLLAAGHQSCPVRLQPALSPWRDTQAASAEGPSRQRLSLVSKSQTASGLGRVVARQFPENGNVADFEGKNGYDSLRNPFPSLSGKGG